MEYKEIIRVLRDVLEDARDHLEYCGYGDSWERKCAIEYKLEERIKHALEISKKYEMIDEEPDFDVDPIDFMDVAKVDEIPE